MSLGYLLDTNALSEASRRKPDPQVLAWLRALPTTRVFFSVISVGEIRKGINLLAPSRRRDTFEQWLQRDLLDRAPDQVLSVTQQVANTWGVLTASRQRSGDPIGLADGLIAATALEHDLTLITRNTRHFFGLGMMLISPWDVQQRNM